MAHTQTRKPHVQMSAHKVFPPNLGSANAGKILLQMSDAKMGEKFPIRILQTQVHISTVSIYIPFHLHTSSNTSNEVHY